MSILTGFKKVKNYILTSSGYQLLSRWTSSQTVEFDDGKTAQTKLGEINGIAKTYVDMKKATDNSMAVSAKAVMEGLENSSALISMTQEEYDALSDEEKTDNNMRAILDANPDVVDAKNVNFDNTNTNLTATNTQSAITELNGKLGNYGNDIVMGKLLSINDNYILDLFKNAPVNYSPTFGQLNIGGPIVAYIMQKHSDYYGGAVIVFGYNNLRPIYYHIENDTIDAEYYL
nr:MAG TPA: hypothetical protein [Caudoviricetes sp.]